MTTTTAAKIGSMTGAGISAFGRKLRRIATAAGLGLLATLPAMAQGQFSPVATVDGEVITSYEYSQRMAFLTLLRAPGDIGQLAMDQLVNQKLQLREARFAGISVDDDAIKAGMEEFAKRGNVTADELLGLLAQGGIAGETLRDFVAAGITWREFSKAAFLPQVSLSRADVDKAMAIAEPEAGLRVLLSEIVLPATDPATRKASKARATRLAGLDETEFEAAAKRFSIGKSRTNGGRMNWLDITALPTDVGAAVRGLTVGKTSRLVETEDDLRIYYLRDREEVSGNTPATAVEYAALLLPGGRSAENLAAAADIRADITSCDGLYPVARGLPPEQLIREELAESQVPGAYRAELDKMDTGEISTNLVTSNGAMVVLMLCKRGNDLPRSLTRSMVSDQLRNSRISTLAQAYLDEMRANARIEILLR